MKKNITLSAEDYLIQQARLKAMQQKRTLNDLFRKWLQQYVESDRGAGEFRALMDRLSYANPGRTFTREEMNER